MRPHATALTTASLLITLAACHGGNPGASLSPPGVTPADAIAHDAVQVFPQFPALSPDASTLVFSWAGDLWALRLDWSGATPEVRATSRLSAHPADERRAAFSPDGRLLAFESTRDGARNLYVMPITLGPAADPGLIATGTPRRITFSDAAQTLGGFTSDSTALLFSASQEPSIYRQSRMYRAPLDAGPVRRLTDAYGFLPRMSADGSSILFSRGYASAIDRPVYRGSGNLELHSFSPTTNAFARITSNAANDVDAFQGPDGSIVFLSSRDGQYNIYRLPKGASDDAQPVQLTHFAVPKDAVTIGHGVRDLAVSADGSHAAFVVWDTLYTLDLTRAGATPTPLPIPLTADTASLDTLRMNLDKSVSEAALSPDGKTLAVVARGEVFVRSTEEGRPTRRVTNTAGRERDIAWSPDGRVLYFASDQTGAYALYTATVSLSRDELEPKPARDALAEEKAATPAAPAAPPAPPASPASATPAPAEPPADAKPTPEKGAEPARADKEPKIDHGKRWADSLLFEVKPLLEPDATDRLAPTPSPDGKELLFTRGRGDLVLLTLETMTQRVLFEGWDQADVQWASDSRHIVYAVSDLDYNSDIWLLDTKGDGAKPVNLTQHPDNDVSPRLSQDGKVLVFLSERAGNNDQFDAWEVYLDKRLEGLKPYELDEYYKKAGEAAAKLKPLGAPASDKKPDAKGDSKPEGDGAKKEPAPLTFDADDAYLRVQRVTTGGEGSLTITPGADRILFSTSTPGAGPEGERAFVSVDRKGEDRKVIQAGPVSDPRVSLTGDKVTFVRAGAVSAAPPKGGKVDALPIDAPVVIDVAAQQRQKFLEAARILGTRFYHPTLKGLDWDALTRRYLALATRTRTSEEFDRVVQLLFGELNGSHTGINSPATYSAPRPAVGVLGASLEPVADGFRVTGVVAGSPADQRTSRLAEGDTILAVDATRLADLHPIPDISQLLLGKAGKETLLEVRHADGSSAHLIIVPTTAADMTNIGYVDEVLRRRAAVEKLSGGRLGYLHIRAMGDASVRDFERDLYAAAHDKDGLVIDVRDNGGGYTTDILLASLTAPAHARTYPRGVAPENVPAYAYPRDRRLIYAYARPINVLINENSFSNAEVFAHAIHTTKRGTLVGTPTFGGVISTGAATLLDGTSVRVPGRGWILPDGKDMENNGAEPEVNVPITPADEAAGRDPQLEAAVKELLGRVG
jgi:tricorn protease